jgi:FMN phosphatase YigB (HAD superfamily)
VSERVIGLDVDHTCIHHEGVQEAIVEFGTNLEVDPQEVRRVLAATAVHFACEDFLTAIDRTEHIADLEAALINTFAENVYDDVIPFMEWARRHSKLVLVTRGREQWQSLKAAPLLPYADGLIITDTIGQKGWRLRERYGDASRMVVVDDRQDELNAVAEAFADASAHVDLYQIKRPDTNYPIGRHQLISNLDELKELL